MQLAVCSQTLDLLGKFSPPSDLDFAQYLDRSLSGDMCVRKVCCCPDEV